jgi:hypothetical protein
MKDRGYTYELLFSGETISEAMVVAGMLTVYVIGVDGRIIHSGFGANETARNSANGLLSKVIWLSTGSAPPVIGGSYSPREDDGNRAAMSPY